MLETIVSSADEIFLDSILYETFLRLTSFTEVKFDSLLTTP